VRAASWLRAGVLRWFPRVFARIYEPTARELGELGEECAVRALIAHGFVILGRRVRTSGAEVDILARDGLELVCVEVKTTRFDPIPIPRGSRIDPRPARFRDHGRLGFVQTARLLEAARALRARSGLRARVDLIEVFQNARSGAVKIEHRRGIAQRWETRSRFEDRGLREPP
jgi:Holliday junction resolvase-like predicted endonuclease